MQALGLSFAAVALLDPLRPSGAWAGPLATAVGLCALPKTRRTALPHFAVVLALAFGLGALVGPRPHADSRHYYVYLRSLFFDGDLDFTNEYEHWHLTRPLTPTGLPLNQYPIGPALSWAPAFPIAHLYVRVDRFLGGRYAADGYSRPYLRSIALPTIAIGVAGAWLLATVLARLFGLQSAVLATVAGVGASPVAYYLFVVPGMAHGTAFGLAAACVWAVDRALRQPSARGWSLVGLLLGAALLVRPTSLPLALLPVLVAVVEVARGRIPARWPALAAAVSLLPLLPQLVAWRVLFGTWMHTGQGFGRGHATTPDWTSPFFWEVLFTAHIGFLVFTPIMAVGILGLGLALRRSFLIALAGGLVFVATAYVTGSLASDWHGSDSFGARRFEAVVPFATLGLAAVLQWLMQRPVLLAAPILAVAVAWNAGLGHLLERNELARPTLPGVAAKQSALVARLTRQALSFLRGERGDAAGYRAFYGDYLDFNKGMSGWAPISMEGFPYLAGGWSEPRNQKGPASHRLAFYPKACLRFPLLRAPQSEVVVKVVLRAARGLDDQELTLRVNRQIATHVRLSREYTTVVADLGPHLHAGENRVCLEFTSYREDADGRMVAASVAGLEVPF